MSDDELSCYIPRHGVRSRLRAHLRKQNTPKKKKNKLLTVLQQKLDAARKHKSADNLEDTDEENMRNPHQPFGNRNPVKQNRQIETLL